MKNTHRLLWLAGTVLAVQFGLSGCATTSPAPVDDRGQAAAAAAAAKGTYVVKRGDTLYSIARDHSMDPRELIAMNHIETPNQIEVGLVLKIRAKDAPQPAAGGATTAPVNADVVVAKPIGNTQATDSRPLGGNSDALKREPKAGKEKYSDEALVRAQGPVPPKPAETAANPTTESAPAGGAAAAESKAPDAAGSDEFTWIWPANGKVVGTFSDAGNKGVDIAGKAGDPIIAAGDGKVVYMGTGLRGYGKLVIIKHNATYLSAYAHNRTILVKEGQTVSKGQKIAEMGNTDAEQVALHFEVRRGGKPVDPLKYLPAR